MLDEGAFTRDNIERAYGVLRTNAFGYTVRNDLKEFDGKKFGDGRALLPRVSLMSHSCFPNVQHTQEGNQVVLVAQRAIKSGEELALSYINHFQGRH